MLRRAMIRAGFGVLPALALAGCVTAGGSQAPTCDGQSRRPLNRSMWDWEQGMQLRSPEVGVSEGRGPVQGSRSAPAGAVQPAAAASARRLAPFRLAPVPATTSTAPQPLTTEVAASTRPCGGAGDTRHG